MAFSPALARRLLAKFGSPATWRTIRPGIRTESGRALTQETVDYDCFAVVLPHDKEQKRSRQNDDTDQRESRSVAYVSVPEGVTPTAKDVLLIGALQYRFEWLDFLAASGTLVLITAGVQE